MKVKKALLVHMSYHTDAHRKTLNAVRHCLSSKGINFKSVHRAQLKPAMTKNIDLVVVVGGDGTFLRSSQFVSDSTPLFGINSDPTYKEGFFLKSKLQTFEKNLDLILAGKAKKTKFTRLEAYLDGEKLSEIALNEFYVGSRKGYRMAAYKIKFGGKNESQKSSGVIVSAGAGTHAWLKSAGGKSTKFDSEQAKFLVREVYGGKLTGQKLLSGTLKKGQFVEVISEMPDGIVIADSVGTEYRFPYGSKVKVKISPKPLYAYWF